MTTMPVIYADGETEEVSETEGEILRRAGLLKWHPGAGEDGITKDDYILSDRVRWDRVRAVLERLRKS